MNSSWLEIAASEFSANKNVNSSSCFDIKEIEEFLSCDSDTKYTGTFGIAEASIPLKTFLESHDDDICRHSGWVINYIDEQNSGVTSSDTLLLPAPEMHESKSSELTESCVTDKQAKDMQLYQIANIFKELRTLAS